MELYRYDMKNYEPLDLLNLFFCYAENSSKENEIKLLVMLIKRMTKKKIRTWTKRTNTKKKDIEKKNKSKEDENKKLEEYIKKKIKGKIIKLESNELDSDDWNNNDFDDNFSGEYSLKEDYNYLNEEHIKIIYSIFGGNGSYAVKSFNDTYLISDMQNRLDNFLHCFLGISICLKNKDSAIKANNNIIQLLINEIEEIEWCDLKYGQNK